MHPPLTASSSRRQQAFLLGHPGLFPRAPISYIPSSSSPDSSDSDAVFPVGPCSTDLGGGPLGAPIFLVAKELAGVCRILCKTIPFTLFLSYHLPTQTPCQAQCSVFASAFHAPDYITGGSCHPLTPRSLLTPQCRCRQHPYLTLSPFPHLSSSNSMPQAEYFVDERNFWLPVLEDSMCGGGLLSASQTEPPSLLRLTGQSRPGSYHKLIF